MAAVTLVRPSTRSAGHSPLTAVGQLRPYAGSPSTNFSGASVASSAAVIADSTHSSGAIGPGSSTEKSYAMMRMWSTCGAIAP